VLLIDPPETDGNGGSLTVGTDTFSFSGDGGSDSTTLGVKPIETPVTLEPVGSAMISPPPARLALLGAYFV
jgi:hypothetical protein